MSKKSLLLILILLLTIPVALASTPRNTPAPLSDEDLCIDGLQIGGDIRFFEHKDQYQSIGSGWLYRGFDGIFARDLVHVSYFYTHNECSITSRGIHVGSTQEDVIQAYGKPTQGNSFMVYETESGYLVFRAGPTELGGGTRIITAIQMIDKLGETIVHTQIEEDIDADGETEIIRILTPDHGYHYIQEAEIEILDGAQVIRQPFMLAGIGDERMDEYVTLEASGFFGDFDEPVLVFCRSVYGANGYGANTYVGYRLYDTHLGKMFEIDQWGPLGVEGVIDLSGRDLHDKECVTDFYKTQIDGRDVLCMRKLMLYGDYPYHDDRSYSVEISMRYVEGRWRIVE